MAIDPRWERVQELVAGAEGQPAAERRAWLELTEYDEGLRSEALEMLEAMEAEAAANAIHGRQQFIAELLESILLTEVVGILLQRADDVIFQGHLHAGFQGFLDHDTWLRLDLVLQ